MTLIGEAALAAIAGFAIVRCRQCGGADCPGVIDGPLFCDAPNPTYALGAEYTDEIVEFDADPRPTDSRGEQITLFDRPEWP